MLIDTHCHLQFRGYKDDVEEVIKRCEDKRMVLNVVGTQKATNQGAIDLAEEYENIYATIGIHPTHLFPTFVDEEESQFISRGEDFDEEYFEKLVRSKKVIGIGETGLDFFHLPKDKSHKEVFEKQKQVFLAHINFAKKHNLPLVIHCRNAHNEMIQLLSEVRGKRSEVFNGVMHCFTGNWEQAQKYLDMGLYLGFTGVITFPPKKTNPKPQTDLEEVIKKIPLNRILVETDAPYLAPQAHRGKRCEPWMVEEVVKKLAKVREKTEKEMEKIVLNNALNLFTGIKLRVS